MEIKKEFFGRTNENKVIYLYTLINDNRMVIKVTNYGGIVTELWAPDRNGVLDDVVLGYDNLTDYQVNKPYFGCIVGRCANRIANSRFNIDDNEYKLSANIGKNHLHGGLIGFNKVVWDSEPDSNEESVKIKLKYFSRDKEEGYPGNLLTNVAYSLNNQNEFQILYEATTDKATPINLTHHSYFNLSGVSSLDILDHEVMINADQYTSTDGDSIPTGKLTNLRNSSFDFTTSRRIGDKINQIEGGYDHNFVLNKGAEKYSLAARAIDPLSGRMMEVLTTEPGLQFYTGNYLNGKEKGKKGISYNKHHGFCLEAQQYPDSPNQPNFPSSIIQPGSVYNQKTVYKFNSTKQQSRIKYP
jgi:aldose 1-epimerase